MVKLREEYWFNQNILWARARAEQRKIKKWEKSVSRVVVEDLLRDKAVDDHPSDDLTPEIVV